MKSNSHIKQSDIARHLGVSPQRVSTWLKLKNIKKPYDLDAIRIAYIKDLAEKAAGRYTEGEVDLIEEKALLAREQRLRTEQIRKAASMELLNRESVLRMWAGIIAELRAKILNTDLTDQMKSDLIENLRDIPVEKYAE